MENKDNIRRLTLNGVEYVLLGTAHVSQESISEVNQIIQEEKPSVVGIELDEGRYASLTDPDSWKKTDVSKVLKQHKGFLMLANIVLAGYQKKMGLGQGVKPGDEMVAAIKKCDELGIKKAMVDRPIATTLRRAWAKNSLFGKATLIAALGASAFSKEEVDPVQIENLKKNSEMDSMMNDLSKEMPKVKQVLIDERDRYLASKIFDAAQNQSKIVAVLGAGHLNGVENHLKELSAGTLKSDVSDIDVVPSKSFLSKCLGWIIPVIIIALLAWGFYLGRGKEMALAWVLWNGCLSAAGAILCGSHPLTVLVSFAGAPLTSLCPFIGVGIVAGLVQAWVCKPKVKDLENVTLDAMSIKGFYKNRLLKVLLVLIFTSIGSSLGTFIAAGKFAEILSKVKKVAVDSSL